MRRTGAVGHRQRRAQRCKLPAKLNRKTALPIVWMRDFQLRITDAVRLTRQRQALVRPNMPAAQNRAVFLADGHDLADLRLERAVFIQHGQRFHRFPERAAAHVLFNPMAARRQIHRVLGVGRRQPDHFPAGFDTGGDAAHAESAAGRV